MSDRRTVSLDFRTGDIRETRTRTPAGETLEERIRGLQAQAAEHAPGGQPVARLVAVECDGCGRVQPLAEPCLPAGWTSGPRGELCPGCQ